MKDKLTQDLKTAMLARDHFLADVIKGLKAAILNQEIAEKKRDVGLSDQEIENLFSKEAKKRLEAAQLYDQGGNQTMADKERAEHDVIMKYLPEQMSEEKIAELIQAAIAETGASSMADMGKVIGMVKAKTGSAADGAKIAQIVKKQLEQK
jgi:uncharacterized protein YqeY